MSLRLSGTPASGSGTMRAHTSSGETVRPSLPRGTSAPAARMRILPCPNAICGSL